MIVLEGLLILDEFCAGRFHTDTKHRQLGHGRAKTRSNDVILAQQCLPPLHHILPTWLRQTRARRPKARLHEGGRTHVSRAQTGIRQQHEMRMQWNGASMRFARSTQRATKTPPPLLCLTPHTFPSGALRRPGAGARRHMRNPRRGPAGLSQRHLHTTRIPTVVAIHHKRHIWNYAIITIGIETRFIQHNNNRFCFPI